MREMCSLRFLHFKQDIFVVCRMEILAGFLFFLWSLFWIMATNLLMSSIVVKDPLQFACEPL